ncbi:putative gustatory receptor 28a [Anoplophora glabripennis]|uniref:putative gustatory receptor 28a n=1 Tax=Anoplophora glabripennis TaxID=217634 RepID=UPI0008750CED|nr:putative gustatory receptor 28a [Anoplophora glabripennis]
MEKWRRCLEVRKPDVLLVLCTIRFYQDLFSALLYLCEIIVGCVFAKKVAEIFRNIDKTDDMLRGLKICISYKRTHIMIIIYITVAFVGVGVILSLLITTELFLACYSSQLPNILVEILSYYLPCVANALTELQYFQYLNFLRLRYKKLNKCLLESTELTPCKIDYELVSTIRLVHPKPAKQETANDPLYIINQVTKIHMILTDTARLTNKTFCFQQLLKIAISFVSIIAGLFLFAMVFAVKDPSKLRIDKLFFLWTLSNALEIFVVVWISAETCKEANECPIILHRIRNSSANEDLKSLIDLHSLQMYHSKLSFSVCGLFPLDYSLLFSVVAGATTYLIILIQFNVDMVKIYDNQTVH